MYSVYCDGELIYDPDSKYNVLVDPTVNLELNKAPTFDFTMPPNHPFYDRIERFKSIIQVLQDGDEIFKGRAIQVQDDMNMNRYVYCEGELAYLNDTIQRPAEFHLDGYAVIRYIEMLLESHNAQVDPDGDYEKYGIGAVPRYFEPGDITIGDPNDYLYRYTNMNTTMEEIKEDLVDDLGGYLRVRNVYKDDNPLGTLEHRYLDYIGIEEYGKTSEQAIEFGENLLDYLSDIDQTDICTGIIPLGALLEEENEFSALETRLTIEDVNDGSDYLVIPEAVEKYGLILKTVTWDDVTTPAALKSNGEAYLATYRYDDMTIEAKAVDLSLITPGESSRETLTSQEVLEAYDTVVYTLTAKNTITEIISYEVYDRDDTGYAKITRISFSGKTVSVTVDNSSRTDDLDITINVVVATTGVFESWRLGDMIPARSAPHNLDDRFPLAKMQIPLAHPENTTVSLGTFTDTSLTAKTNSTANGLRNFEDFSTGNIIASAVAQATKLIDTKTNGYVTLHYDEDRGCVDELLIMDTPDTSTAKRVWRWNLSGLGYSSTGYSGDEAAYGTAITMDGTILGTFIIGNGMILADDKDVEFAKFDDTGMKIYAQSGRDDLMLMTIGRTGMDIYDDTGKDILASFNPSGVQVYNGGLLSSSLFGNGMTFYNSNGDQVILRLFQQGLMVNDDDGNTLVTLTSSGETFYYNGDNVGNIGTGYWTGYPNNRGLGFHLENSASFMTWGWRKTSSASEYTSMIAYHTSNSSEVQGVHIGDTLFLRGNKLYFGEKETGGYVQLESNGGALFDGAEWFFQNCRLWYGANSSTCYEVATQRWVNDQDFAYYSDLSSLESTVSGLNSSLSSLSRDVSSISNSLSNYALKSDIPTVPSNVSAFTNDAGYITSNDLSNYITRDTSCTIAIRDGNNAQYNGSFSYSGTFSVNLNTFLTNVGAARGWGSGGYPDDIECSSVTASGTITADRFGSTTNIFEFDGESIYFNGTNTIGLGFGSSSGPTTNLVDIWAKEISLHGTVDNDSDQRLKTSIQPLTTSALDNLTPVSFKWKSGDERTHYGYIAQEVQQYFPELVSGGTDGMLGLAYTELIPLLHMEIKALKEEIAQLKKGAA